VPQLGSDHLFELSGNLFPGMFRHSSNHRWPGTGAGRPPPGPQARENGAANGPTAKLGKISESG